MHLAQASINIIYIEPLIISYICESRHYKVRLLKLATSHWFELNYLNILFSREYIYFQGYDPHGYMLTLILMVIDM